MQSRGAYEVNPPRRESGHVLGTDSFADATPITQVLAPTSKIPIRQEKLFLAGVPTLGGCSDPPPCYVATRFRQPTHLHPERWMGTSRQYAKAMKASFPADRWPAREIVDPDGGVRFVLKDGTEIHQIAPPYLIYDFETGKPCGRIDRNGKTLTLCRRQWKWKLSHPRTKLKWRLLATTRCLAAKVPSAARRGTVAVCRMGFQNNIDACGGQSIIDRVKARARALTWRISTWIPARTNAIRRRSWSLPDKGSRWNQSRFGD